MLTKSCSKCKEVKDLSEFHNSSTSSDGKKAACKSCRNSESKEWNLENKERKSETNRWWSKKNKYSISKEEYLSILESQNELCAICGKHYTDSLYGHLYVDHCHSSGKVRGLLCNHCNTLLGMAKDSLDILDKARQYLSR